MNTVSAARIAAVGSMPVPPGFKYMNVLLAGRPRHGRFDEFSLKHPKMDVGHRAKIFAPFDALRGFSEAVNAKDEQYVEKAELSQDRLDAVNACLNLLYDALHGNKSSPSPATSDGTGFTVSVTYFVPCRDPQNDAFGRAGQYLTVRGPLRTVDREISRSIIVENTKIAFEDIYEIKIRR